MLEDAFGCISSLLLTLKDTLTFSMASSGKVDVVAASRELAERRLQHYKHDARGGYCGLKLRYEYLARSI